MYGRTCFGNQRATFVVEEQGTVAHVIPKASVKTTTMWCLRRWAIRHGGVE